MNQPVAPAASPAAPATPAAAPAANQVVVDQQAVGSPTPVGSQAPPAPVTDVKGSKHRPESRREVIQRAFQRASGEPVTPRARDQKAPEAKAKIGHNQPPEPTKVERKFDLRHPPLTDKEARRVARREERARGEHGHFAPKEPGQQQMPGQQQRSGRQQRQRFDSRTGQPVQRLPREAPYRAPLKRMSQQAKTEWHTSPESVRGEVYRMQSEFNNFYARTRGDRETMDSIRHFDQMARQHGTSLHKALTNYVSMENKLREDPVGGLDVIVNNLNLRTPEGHRIGLRDIAWHVLNQTPDQHRALQTQNRQTAQDHQLSQLYQVVSSLAQNQQQMQYGQQFAQKRSEVDRFAETHPRLDELGPAIERELKFGFDLPTAYRRAELLYSSRTQAPQTRTPAAQTRAADRSISGAPAGGTSMGRQRQQRNGKIPDRRESIAAAIRHVNGSL